MNLQQHPLSAAFPAMPENELGALALDIETHGQREPGVLYEGKVLDGWHRYLACEKAGAKFKSEEFDGDDPVAFVLSRNLHRRHLTAAQRVAAVAECANWAPAHRQGNKEGTGSLLISVTPLMTNAQIAEAADASEKTVKQVKAGIRAGLGDAIKAGMVSAKDAAAVASGKAPAADKPKVIVADRKFEKLYEAVKAELVETKEKLSEVGETARELEGKLTAFETTDPDEQQKEILKLQKRILRLEQEVERVTRARNDCQAKNNELIREVKRLRREAGK